MVLYFLTYLRKPETLKTSNYNRSVAMPEIISLNVPSVSAKTVAHVGIQLPSIPVIEVR